MHAACRLLHPLLAALLALGLTAAATAAEGRRVVLVIDSGAFRNDPALLGVAEAVATAPPSGEAGGFEGALALLQRSRWSEAERAFEAFLDANPDEPRASSAAYWLAEAYFFQKRYRDAAAAFARNYRTYGPEAPKAAENLLKLGISRAALGDRKEACQSFAELAKRYPDASAPIRRTLAREREAAGCG